MPAEPAVPAEPPAGTPRSAGSGAEDDLAAALVEETAKRSSVLWVQVADRPPRLVWHAWSEGAAWVVLGGGEQEDPELADAGRVRVLSRSKDRGGRLVSWDAAVVPVEPGDERWDAGVGALLAARLNAPDGEAAAQRWARESVVLRLEPVAPARPTHGVDEGSQAAPPPPSGATTRTPLPRMLRRRGGGASSRGALRGWWRSRAPRP